MVICPMLQFVSGKCGSEFLLKHEHIEKINALYKGDISQFLRDVLGLSRLNIRIKVSFDEDAKKYELKIVTRLNFGLNSDVFATEQDIKKELDFVAKYSDDPDVRSRYLFLSVFGNENDVALITANENTNRLLKKEMFTTVKKRLDIINEQINKNLSSIGCETNKI